MTDEEQVLERIVIATKKGYGLTSADLSKRTCLSLRKVRKALRRLKYLKLITFYADWYGSNAGYRRCYVLVKTKEG